MDVIEGLEQEAKAGFRHLLGTHLTGTVPLREAVINVALGHLPQAPPGLSIEVLPSNRIVARWGLVRATAVLDEVVDVGGIAPQVGLELASGVVAWTLARMLRMPAVRIDGRRVAIDLSALDGSDGLRPYWPLLRSVRLRTAPGLVQVDFEVAVA
jgi:hypothetical protein